MCVCMCVRVWCRCRCSRLRPSINMAWPAQDGRPDACKLLQILHHLSFFSSCPLTLERPMSSSVCPLPFSVPSLTCCLLSLPNLSQSLWLRTSTFFTSYSSCKFLHQMWKQPRRAVCHPHSLIFKWQKGTVCFLHARQGGVCVCCVGGNSENPCSVWD